MDVPLTTGSPVDAEAQQPSSAGGPGGDGKKKDMVVSRATVIFLAFTCFYVRSQAATGAEEGWKCRSEQGNTDDGGAGRELTTTLRDAMTLQAPFFLVFLLAVVGLPSPWVGRGWACLKKVPPCGQLCLSFLLFSAWMGVSTSWLEAVELVFGKTGSKCDDINGPNGREMDNLLWWSKFFLGVQIFWVALFYYLVWQDRRADPNLTWSAALLERHFFPTVVS